MNVIRSNLFDFAQVEVDADFVFFNLDGIARKFSDDRELNLQPDDWPLLDDRQVDLEVLHDFA